MEQVKNPHELVELARMRAENFYEAHRFCCSEAVLFVLNQAFAGNLPSEVVLRLGSGFCGGIGGAGSLCGALSGAVMAVGLLLGPNQAGGLKKKELDRCCRQLHDRFQKECDSTICRDLVAPFQDNRSQRRENCKKLTGLGAALALEIILENAPHLAQRADLDFLQDRDSRFKAMVSKLGSFFKLT